MNHRIIEPGEGSAASHDRGNIMGSAAQVPVERSAPGEGEISVPCGHTRRRSPSAPRLYGGESDKIPPSSFGLTLTFPAPCTASTRKAFLSFQPPSLSRRPAERPPFRCSPASRRRERVRPERGKEFIRLEPSVLPGRNPCDIDSPPSSHFNGSMIELCSKAAATQ
jgi:hypothetical protein